MTKKDYELIAGILAKAYAVHGGFSLSANEVIGQIHAEFCRKLEADNSRFNSDLFDAFIIKAEKDLKGVE